MVALEAQEVVARVVVGVVVARTVVVTVVAAQAGRVETEVAEAQQAVEEVQALAMVAVAGWDLGS